MAPKTKKGNKAQGSVSQLSEEFAATNLENDDDGKSAAKDSAKKPDSVDEPVTRESQDQDPFRFLLPKLADSARALSTEHPLYKKVMEYAGNLVAVADWESFKTDFLEPCLPNRPGLVRQLIFVVTENDHHLGHLLFQLLAHLLPPQDEKHDDEDDEDEDEGANDVFASPDALGGFAWAKVLRACEVQHFHPLVMYKPTYYTDVKTENPITAFFWCPVAGSIVGEDIMTATPNAQAIRNFQNILRDYPELKARLISVRNLNPSLCHEYWPSKDPFEDRRPEVYKAQIDQACNEMAQYVNANRVPSLENTSYLIMCGEHKMKNEGNQLVKTENFVRGYLAKKFPQKPNPSPQLVVCGHYFKIGGIPVLAKMLGVKPQAAGPEGLDAKPKNIETNKKT